MVLKLGDVSRAVSQLEFDEFGREEAIANERASSCYEYVVLNERGLRVKAVASNRVSVSDD